MVSEIFKCKTCESGGVIVEQPHHGSTWKGEIEDTVVFSCYCPDCGAKYKVTCEIGRILEIDYEYA